VAGLTTAFTATYGAGELVIGLCAEYDALPEVGHACGHNIIAAASAGAALALRYRGQAAHAAACGRSGAAPNIVPADTSARYYLRALSTRATTESLTCPRARWSPRVLFDGRPGPIRRGR
jgi:metal-dependent amidase/aminoacylase/carboxypeptidase family protein